MPSPAPLPPPATLVQLQNLTSATGLAINSRLAVVLSHESDQQSRTRLRIRLLPTPTLPSTIHHVKPANAKLAPIPSDPPAFNAYLLLLLREATYRSRTDPISAKSFHHRLTHIPGHSPPVQVRSVYASFLCVAGEYGAAIPVLESLAAQAHPMRDRFRSGLAHAYIQTGRLHDALDLVKTMPATGESREMKLHMLQAIALPMHDQFSPHEVEVCKELLKLRPDQGITLWNMGAALCRQGRVQAGADAYRCALERGTGLSEEQRARIKRDLHIAEHERDGVFGESRPLATLPDGSVICVEGGPNAMVSTGGKTVPLSELRAKRQNEGA